MQSLGKHHRHAEALVPDNGLSTEESWTLQESQGSTARIHLFARLLTMRTAQV